jgi:hypothetical protein
MRMDIILKKQTRQPLSNCQFIHFVQTAQGTSVLAE